METGFLVNFHSGGEPWGNDLPRVLHADDSLDADIDRIADAIRAWIRNPKGLSHLHISLSGPIKGVNEILRTPEEKLSDAKNQHDRFHALGKAAKSRFNAGDFDVAREYALELEHIMLAYSKDPFFGSAKSSVNIVLGRLALQAGDVEGAERHLLAAGDVPGSPTLESFGPNMSLAHDLLLAGHSGAVLEYFKLCTSFWSPKFSKLDQWTEDVLAGRIPDFDANLVY